MKKVKEVSTKYRVTKSDNDPVKCGDHITLTRKVISHDNDTDVVRAPKPPKWFQAFEGRNNARLDKIDTRLGNLENRVSNIESDVQTINARLEQQDEFNQYVRNVFERNNLH
jgi:hypothetical protein